MVDKVVEEFVEQMGMTAQADGLPRIAGRMFGLFVIEGGTRSFSEIAERLEVSRGSISTNARILEALGVIQRTAKPGDRQDYFQLTADPYARLLEGYVTRMQRTEAMASNTLESLSPGSTQARERIKEMVRFYQAAVESTQRILENWDAGRRNAS